MERSVPTGDGTRGDRPTSSVSPTSMVVVRRQRKRKDQHPPTFAKLQRKVRFVYVLLWTGLVLLAVPFLIWIWMLASYNQFQNTFAVITVKYAAWVVSIFEIGFLALSFIMGVLRLVNFKDKKIIKRIRLTADVTTGLFVAQLLVYIPLSGFTVTRFRARIYDEMKLTMRTTRDFEKRDDVWEATQIQHKCCGIEGPKDWNWVKSKLTKSCCDGPGVCTKEKAYTTGCYEHEKQLVDLYFLMLGIPNLAFQLILIIATFYGFGYYRTNSKKIRMHKASEKAKKLSESRSKAKDDDEDSPITDTDAPGA